MGNHKCGYALDNKLSSYSQTDAATNWFMLNLGTIEYVSSIRIVLPLHFTSSPAPLTIRLGNLSTDFDANNNNQKLLSKSKDNNTSPHEYHITSSFESTVSLFLASRFQMILIQRDFKGTLGLAEIQIIQSLTNCYLNCSNNGNCLRTFNTWALDTDGKEQLAIPSRSIKHTLNHTCSCNTGYYGIGCENTTSSAYNNKHRGKKKSAPMEISFNKHEMFWLIVACVVGSVSTCACLFICMCMFQHRHPEINPTTWIRTKQTMNLPLNQNLYEMSETGSVKVASMDNFSRIVPISVKIHVPPAAIGYLFASPIVRIRKRYQSWHATREGEEKGKRKESIATTIATRSFSLNNVECTQERSSPTLHVSPISEQLDIDSELLVLQQSVSERGVDIDVLTATTDNLLSMLSTNKHEVLHISCHCTENQLVFEDEHSSCHLISSTTLSKAFRNRGRHVRLVVLNSCNSAAIAQQLIGTNRAAIGTRGAVKDELSAYFTQHLYMSIAASNCPSSQLLPTFNMEQRMKTKTRNTLPPQPIPLSEAFEMAIDAIRASSRFTEQEANQFVLFPASNGLSSNCKLNDPILFTGVKKYVDHSHRLSPPRTMSPTHNHANDSHLPTLTEDFIGREIDVYRILRVLGRRRVVILAPSNTIEALDEQSGMGTSSLSVKVAYHVQRRSRTSNGCMDGVFYTRHCKNVHEIMKQWNLQLDQRLQSKSSHNLYFENVCTPPEEIYMKRNGIGSFLNRIRQNQRCLLVIDQFESFRTTKGIIELSRFLNTLLQTASKLKILITTSTHSDALRLIEGEGDATQARTYKPCLIQINGLSNMSSAILLAKRSLRPISLEELNCGDTSEKETEQTEQAEGETEERKLNTVCATTNEDFRNDPMFFCIIKTSI